MSSLERSPLETRVAFGHSLRTSTPRRSLATLANRPDAFDPVAHLVSQGETRIAALLPLRYKRMLASSLAFYRGAALLMAQDLALGPSTSLEVQICGDAHLANFGVFSSPERRLVFDVDDFDEVDRGPFEWDVKRLAASLVIASEQLGHATDVQETVVLDAARAYQRSIRRFATQTRLDVWYASLDVTSVMVDLRDFFSVEAARSVDGVIRRARGKGSRRTSEHLIDGDSGSPRLNLGLAHLSALGALEDEALLTRADLEIVLEGYASTLSNDRRTLLRQFTPRDAAHQVVGVGSVGTQCYVWLLTGRDDDDIFFLQVKEAEQSVIAVARSLTPTGEAGERVVAGQRLMQATPDVLLGWHTMEAGGRDRSFYVRQLYGGKASIALDELDGPRLAAYARACAWVLARAHARSGRAAEIAGYVGTGDRFAQSIATFALDYRDRNEADFREFQRAAAEGRIAVAP